ARRPAAGAGDRGIAKGIIGLLRVAIAFHDQELRLHIGPGVFLHHRMQHRPDLPPDGLPHHGSRHTQRFRVFTSHNGDIRVVIKFDEIFAPAEPYRLAAIKHNADTGTQTLGPGFHRPQRCRRPIVVTDTLAHLAAARKEFRDHHKVTGSNTRTQPLHHKKRASDDSCPKTNPAFSRAGFSIWLLGSVSTTFSWDNSSVSSPRAGSAPSPPASRYPPWPFHSQCNPAYRERCLS